MSQHRLLRTALAQACSVLPAEIRSVPLEHWNESVFRFLLVRQLLSLAPDTSCWSEWNRVDLVLSAPTGATLVEIKFYTHGEIRDHAGRVLRSKGGPSKKNVLEFNASLATLADSANMPWAVSCGGVAAAFLVLAYFDPVQASKGKDSFAKHYGHLLAGGPIVAVDTIVQEIPVGESMAFTCKLIEVRID